MMRLLKRRTPDHRQAPDGSELSRALKNVSAYVSIAELPGKKTIFTSKAPSPAKV